MINSQGSLPEKWGVNMSNVLTAILLVAVLIIGVVLGGAIIFFNRNMAVNRLLRVTQRKVNRTIIESREEAKKIIEQGKVDADKVRTTADAEYKERRLELQRQENRLLSKTENLEHKLEGIGQRERALANREKSLDNLQAQIEEAKGKELKQLEIISGMSIDQAKEMLLQSIESEMKGEASRRLHEWEIKIKAEADLRSQEILAQTIQRSASEIVSETTATSVPIPSDEMKGRLIGREGRNIRALEQATGVDLIVDDTPEAVTLIQLRPGAPRSRPYRTDQTHSGRPYSSGAY